MEKYGLMQFHALLLLIRREYDADAPAEAYAEYESMDLSPMDFTAMTRDHHEAVLALAEALNRRLEKNDRAAIPSTESSTG